MCVTWVFVANFRSLNTSEMACIYTWINIHMSTKNVWLVKLLYCIKPCLLVGLFWAVLYKCEFFGQNIVIIFWRPFVWKVLEVELSSWIHHPEYGCIDPGREVCYLSHVFRWWIWCVDQCWLCVQWNLPSRIGEVRWMCRPSIVTTMIGVGCCRDGYFL